MFLVLSLLLIRITVASGWTLVFKVATGGERNVYDLYTNNGTLNVGNVQAQSLTNPIKEHFKSEVVDLWSSINIDQVRVAVYNSGTEVAHFLFNGTGSNKIDWFSHNRLLSSSYTDVVTSNPEVFSISGSGYRRFLMTKAWGSTCFDDDYWLSVVDTESTNICDYEQEYTGDRPAVLYSSHDHFCRFSWHKTNILAESLAVFVEFGDTTTGFTSFGNNDMTTTSSGNNDMTTTSSGNNDMTTSSPGNNEMTTTTTGNNEMTTTTTGNNEMTTTSPANNDMTTTNPDNNEMTTTSPNNNGMTTTSPGNNEMTTTRPANNDMTTTSPDNNEMTTTSPNNNGMTTAGPGNKEMTTTSFRNNDMTTAIPGNNEMTTTCSVNNGLATSSMENTKIWISNTTNAYCICQFCPDAYITEAELAVMVANLKKALTIDKRNTSRYKRLHTSVYEDRRSAKIVGGFGIFVISGVASLFMLIDLVNLKRHWTIHRHVNSN